MRRVVVTGYGAISPVGNNAEANWKALMAAESGIGPITQFDCTQYASRIAGEVKNYDGKDHFSVKELKKMDRFIQFCLLAGAEAVKSADLDFEKENAKERLGACIGVGIGGLIEIQNWYREILDRGPRRVTPFFIPSIIANLAPGFLAIRYGLKGPNTVITTACSSSAHAIGESVRTIQRGDADLMLAGGAEAVICELAFAGFCAARALSTRNDEPTRASRPYDKDRDGFVMGEGSAVLVLEEYERAKSRGAKILAEVVGYGSNCDAFHITQPSQDGEGAVRCMRLALDSAKLKPEDIDYVNTHGTSTPLGDAMETQALKTVYGDWAYKLAVSSTKSMTGHLLGAAGALEAMFCVQALENQVVPPTINLENPSPECDLNYVPNEPQKRRVRSVMTNSFGFGGTNATLIFSQLNDA
ncbi:MAG: beta-ketoacyl-ACP synthase II [Bdellovibrionales bacterium]|nr:beta-ketoacyl-ACP synthase II [Bdellovibrionales bacterium]